MVITRLGSASRHALQNLRMRANSHRKEHKYCKDVSETQSAPFAHRIKVAFTRTAPVVPRLACIAAHPALLRSLCTSLHRRLPHRRDALVRARGAAFLLRHRALRRSGLACVYNCGILTCRRRRRRCVLRSCTRGCLLRLDLDGWCLRAGLCGRAACGTSHALIDSSRDRIYVDRLCRRVKCERWANVHGETEREQVSRVSVVL